MQGRSYNETEMKLGPITFFEKDEFNQREFMDWPKGYLHFYNQWEQFFQPKRYNWITFTFFYFYVEYDKMFGEAIRVDFAFMGFTFDLYHHFWENEEFKKLERDADRALKQAEKKKSKKK